MKNIRLTGVKIDRVLENNRIGTIVTLTLSDDEMTVEYTRTLYQVTLATCNRLVRLMLKQPPFGEPK